ncbi:MAG: GNAT family N-acetyltransferase [Myxococcota bacterium]
MSGEIEVRLATAADAMGIAEAHMDSIATLGAVFYGPEIVQDWGRPRGGERYVEAMARGETFFVAVERAPEALVVGFASHRVSGGAHRTAVYVAGRAARRGVGTALFERAQTVAAQQGADAIEVDASLAAVEFYRSLGFEVVSTGQHRIRSGAMMDCAFMRKLL